MQGPAGGDSARSSPCSAPCALCRRLYCTDATDAQGHPDPGTELAAGHVQSVSAHVELIVLFLYLCIKKFPLVSCGGLQVGERHPVFHQHSVHAKLVSALLHGGQDAEEPLVHGIQVRLGQHWGDGVVGHGRL